MIYIWKKERNRRGEKSQQDAENYGKNRREKSKKIIKKRQAKRT